MNNRLIILVSVSLFSCYNGFYFNEQVIAKPTNKPINRSVPNPALEGVKKGDLLIKPILKQFLALQSRLTIGLTFSEYRNYIGNLLVALDEIKTEPDVVKNLSYMYLVSALLDYQTALHIWKYYLERGRDYIYVDDDVTKVLIKQYSIPVASFNERVILKSDALSIIWGEASKQIVKAQNSLSGN